MKKERKEELGRKATPHNGRSFQKNVKVSTKKQHSLPHIHTKQTNGEKCWCYNAKKVM